MILCSTSLCSAQRVLSFLYRQHRLTMRQSNNIDDAMNDAVMVVDHQQKRRTFLYIIRSIYIYLHFVLGVQLGYDMLSGAAPSL